MPVPRPYSQIANRPRVLRPGDTVVLVSPSGPTRAARVEPGIELLSSWGLSVTLGTDVYARNGFLAGTDAQRLASLNAAFRDPSVRGVICTRGGYGAQRIVDGLDVEAAAADPKVFVGFSDITALQLALWRGSRLATIHGPGAGWVETRTPAASAESLRATIMTTDIVRVAADPSAETAAVRVDPGTGPATGTLLGGNLCLLTASVGTPDFPDLTGSILLMEDVEEPPYKVDRMLTHLRRAGVLAGLAGVAVGQFTRCADAWDIPVAEVLAERLADLGVPVLGGLPIGHGYAQQTVPVGVPATLDAAAGTLTVEPAVVDA
jgi:muramoyltetrapeptide carboxypeptidase